jgi:hypothetical protein
LCAEETGLACEREAARTAEILRLKKKAIAEEKKRTAEIERLKQEAKIKAEAEAAARIKAEQEQKAAEEKAEAEAKRKQPLDRLFEIAREETDYMEDTSRAKALRLSLLAYLEVFAGRKECEEAFSSQFRPVLDIEDACQSALALGKCVYARWKACPDIIDSKEIHALLETIAARGDSEDFEFIVNCAVEAFCNCRQFEYAKRWTLKTQSKSYCEQLINLGLLDKAKSFISSLNWDNEDIQSQWSFLARACIQNKLYDDALIIRNILDSEYKKDDIIFSISSSQANNDQIEEANKTLQTYESFYDTPPGKSRALLSIAKAYGRKGQTEKALSYIGKFPRIFNVWLYLNIARGLIRSGKSFEALNLINEDLASVNKRDIETLREGCATALVKNDEVDKATAIHDPKNNTIYENDYKAALVAYHIRNNYIEDAENLATKENFGDRGTANVYQALAKYHANHRDRILPFVDRLEARRNSWCVSAYTLTMLAELLGVSKDFYKDLIH